MFSPIMQLLERALGGATQRHMTLAHNVANINTPGFQRQEVDFQATLKRDWEAASAGTAMRTTHESHLQLPRQHSVSSLWPPLSSPWMRHDGNTVDLESAMAELAKNALYFSTVSRQLGAQLARVRTAITEGRR